MKRISALLLLFCITVAAMGRSFAAPTLAANLHAEAFSQSLSAQSAVLMEADSRTVLHEQTAHIPMGMASTTKIMTALVTAERLEADTVVTVPPQAVGIEGSSVYLVEGEPLTVKELLYALILASANDAAVALAIAVAGSEEAFCALMNEKAASLGLIDTHFENPHGLADDEHYTTAYELALLSAAVLEHPLLREIAATKRTAIPFDGTPNGRYLVNHNKMLTQYEGAIGLKTGFTKKTGRCLVSAACRDGMTLIAVTLNAPDDWRDHKALLDYGFDTYKRLTLFETGGFSYALPLVGGVSKTVILTNQAPLSLLLPKDHPTPTLKVELVHRFAFAPVLQEDVLGTLVLHCGEQSTSSPLAVAETALRKQEKRNRLMVCLEAIRDRIAAFFQSFAGKE
ncbi:MAG: D-alanyl-D-alanine carboxypeptidase [Clostridia bacterium]|nr:D-alanyl-D-alanine carboxypeptidase [Clostridia bacterium]